MAQDNRASAINERLFGASKIDPDAAQKGWVVGKDAGQMSAQASPAAFLDTAVNKYKESQLSRAQIQQEQQKARASKLQQMLMEANQIKSGLASKYAMGGNLSPQELAQANNADQFIKSFETNPMMQQLIGIDPSKSEESSGSEILKSIFGGGSDGMTGAGANLPPGTTFGLKTGAGTLNIPVNQKYSKEEADLISVAGTVIDAAEQLKSGLGFKNEFLPGLSGGPFRKGTQKFQKAKDYMLATLLQLKSGAAVTPQEYERWSKLITPSLAVSKEADAENLNRFIQEFSTKFNLVAGGRSALGQKQPMQSQNSDFQILSVEG